VAAVLLIFACNIPPFTGQSQTETPIPSEASDPTIAITGPVEVVYDWSTDRCDFRDWPDMPLRPFRDANGMVQANRSQESNRRFMGPELDSIEALCDVTLQSSLDPNPSKYNNHQWMQAFYTEDGQTVHAIVHNEENNEGSSYHNMTYAVSTDAGATFQQPDPPAHLVATMPLKFEKGLGLYSMSSGSNIIKGKDGYYYTLALRQEINVGDSHVCLLRTDDLSDPAAWRAWLKRSGTREKEILSLTAAGRVREFRLRYRVGFRLHDAKGNDYVPQSSLELTRDVSFNDTQVLAKEAEEQLLFRDMQNDMVQQILRRLAAARAPG